MHDLSAPIHVNGRHWGGFRIGYRSADPEQRQVPQSRTSFESGLPRPGLVMTPQPRLLPARKLVRTG